MVSMGFTDLKTVFPATKTSAPACTMEAALSKVTPPSISIWVCKPLLLHRLLNYKPLI
jgi:hypothetical protein